MGAIVSPLPCQRVSQRQQLRNIHPAGPGRLQLKSNFQRHATQAPQAFSRSSVKYVAYFSRNCPATQRPVIAANLHTSCVSLEKEALCTFITHARTHTHIRTHTHTHTHTYTRCFFNFPSPFALNLCIMSEQTRTSHILLDTMLEKRSSSDIAEFHRSPSSQKARPVSVLDPPSCPN